MRTLALIVLTPLLAQARVCGGSASTEVSVPAPTVAVSANAALVPIASKHGGTVVTVEDVQMELLVKGDGQVVAYPVQNPAAPAVAPTLQANAQVTVDVPVQSGGTRPVELVWSPVEARFVGQVQGATVVTTRPADVQVTVVANGRRRHHRMDRHYVMVPAGPEVRVVTAPPPVVVVERPRAEVRVQVPAPVIDVRIGGPSVRYQVDVDHHHDEHGMRGHHDNGLHLGHGGGGGMGHGRH